MRYSESLPLLAISSITLARNSTLKQYPSVSPQKPLRPLTETLFHNTRNGLKRNKGSLRTLLFQVFQS